MSTYFSLYKIFFVEKISIPWKTVKGKQFFAWKDKKFWEDGIMKLPEKMAEDSGTKQWICCSVKFLVKRKNLSFIFT